MSFVAAARALRSNVSELKALISREICPLLSTLIKERYSNEAVKAMVELAGLQESGGGAVSVPIMANRCKRCADDLRSLSRAFPETSAHWIAIHMVIVVFTAPSESSQAAKLPLTTLLKRLESHLQLIKRELSFLLKLVKALDKVSSLSMLQFLSF